MFSIKNQTNTIILIGAGTESCSIFPKKKFIFKEKGTHYEYFWNFFHEAYYSVKMDEGNPRIGEYFYKLFDFKHKKSRSELDMLTEVYKLLEQNLKK